uniref:Uncharacterized protein n=1 Tax=Rhodococcus sp. NS1 TaxID=402236 RepID=A0A097SPU9_9NOCA|nr:hypothetical protein LRS1606.118 [Rhodococcus sp. NS1]
MLHVCDLLVLVASELISRAGMDVALSRMQGEAAQGTVVAGRRLWGPAEFSGGDERVDIDAWSTLTRKSDGEWAGRRRPAQPATLFFYNRFGYQAAVSVMTALPSRMGCPPGL